MPVKLRFTLEGPRPPGPYRHANGLRALVLRWLQAANPELSTAVHDVDQPKPCTVGPLITRDGLHQFEVVALVDWLEEPLLLGREEVGSEVWLGPQRFQQQAAYEASRVSWEELRRPTPGFRRAEVTLLSPTAHHTGRELRRAVILPDPALYFGSWLQRWNLCCAEGMDPGLVEFVRERVAVTACRGETQAERSDPPRVFIGFVGEVKFSLLKPDAVRPEIRSELAALARFAELCGTGVETMRGMGQTRTSIQ